MEHRIRKAMADDMPGAARTFCEAFPESIRRYSPFRLPFEAISDIFEMCRRAQPDFFFVFEEDGDILGYIISPLSMSLLALRSVLSGNALRIGFRYIAGRYGIKPKNALKASINAIRNLFLRQKGIESCDSRILSIAVSPRAQGRGIGKALALKGLEALEAAGAAGIRLEVRKDNAPARKLYERLGFLEAGIIADETGTWVAMVRKNGK